jgi:ABC-type lipoprotein export system ATPase subunit
MEYIALSEYTVASVGTGRKLEGIDFSLSAGDVCAIAPGSWMDADAFLRALATLNPPLAGVYRFGSETLDFSDYRKLLPVKRRIGYVASDAALISNRTLRENLLIMRQYFENSLTVSLDRATASLCRKLGIEAELDRRPSEVDPIDVQTAIAIREIGKSPEVLLLDRPEEFLGQSRFRILAETIEDMIDRRVPIVVLTENRMFADQFVNRWIHIEDGRVTVKPATGGNRRKNETEG